MTRYWLDANILIQAKNGPYGFDIVPAFWTWLDQQAALGQIRVSTTVYEELADSGDELSKWVRDRKDGDLFVEPDRNAQAALSEIANHVNTSYPPPQAALFLGGADPWVIAHAKVDRGTVVTHEILVPDTSTKVKIPNICSWCGVSYVDTYVMLRQLGARFTL